MVNTINIVKTNERKYLQIISAKGLISRLYTELLEPHNRKPYFIRGKELE